MSFGAKMADKSGEDVDFKSLNVGTRVVQIVKILCRENASTELTTEHLSQLENFPHLVEFKRSLSDNRPYWNTLRFLPEALFCNATITEIKLAYHSIQSICNGDMNWNREIMSQIETLQPVTVCNVLYAEHPKLILADIPDLVIESISKIISHRIYEIAKEIAEKLNLKVSYHNSAAFAVDTRSIQNKQQLVMAIPLLMQSALSANEQSIEDGLDLIAIRNAYANGIEMKKSLSNKFDLNLDCWAEAIAVAHNYIVSKPNDFQLYGSLCRLIVRLREHRAIIKQQEMEMAL